MALGARWPTKLSATLAEALLDATISVKLRTAEAQFGAGPDTIWCGPGAIAWAAACPPAPAKPHLIAQHSCRPLLSLLAALAAAMLTVTAWLAAIWLGVRARRRQRAAPSTPKAHVPNVHAKEALPPSPGAGTSRAAGKRATGGSVINITATAAAAQPLAPPAPASSPQPRPLPPHSVRFISGLDVTPAMVARLEAELAGGHNRFVCLLCHQMVKEQLAAAEALRASPASPAAEAERRRLSAQHFAVLEAGGRLVAAAFFYPRRTSKGGGTAGCPAAPAAPAPACGDDGGSPRAAVAAAGGGAPEASAPSAVDPHAYIELMCCCQPGAGWGASLLAAVERFVAQHARGALAVDGRPLRAVKLLSVGSAESFYRRWGYTAPDHLREMAKLLDGA